MSLERTWGTYRYNVYLFQGMLFTIAGSFLLMGYCYLFHQKYTTNIAFLFLKVNVAAPKKHPLIKI